MSFSITGEIVFMRSGASSVSVATWSTFTPSLILFTADLPAFGDHFPSISFTERIPPPKAGSTSISSMVRVGSETDIFTCPRRIHNYY